MTAQWHGGKGSKPRPTNLKAYESNFDDIFRKAPDPEPAPPEPTPEEPKDE